LSLVPVKKSSIAQLHHLTVILVAIMICLYNSVQAQVKPVRFLFNLDSASNTSAGIFSHDGRLVRTLWSAQFLTAGSHSCEWDRLDDFGHLLVDTGYHLQLLSARVKYNWEGTIGNNSDSITGSSKIRHYDRIKDMLVVGNWLYYAAGYSEGVPSSYKINLNQPNRKYNILFEGKENVDQDAEYLASDSSLVYWAGMDPFNPANYFVYATTVDSDSEVLFDSGQSIKMYYGRTYASVIALDTSELDSKITGLAVQKQGSFLYVSRALKDQLEVYNKLTGQLVNTVYFNAPSLIHVDTKDRLWMLHGVDTLVNLDFDSLGRIDTIFKLKKMEQKPLAFALSGDDSLILAIYGDSLQQVFAYNLALDTVLWIQGQKGGYSQNNLVADDKFYFSDTVTHLSQPFICFGPGRSYWLSDVGNDRVLHFSDSGTKTDEIQYLPHFYSVAVDLNDSSRVFNAYLEFKVDYNLPLGPKNGSWSLHRNWRAGVDKSHYNPSGNNILRNMITLSNGVTIAYMDYIDSFNMRYPEMVVLPDSGNFIFTGRRLGKFDYRNLSKSAAQIWLNGGSDIGQSPFILKSELDSFDTNAWPVWNNMDTIARVPAITEWSPAYRGVMPVTKTEDNRVILFNPGKLNTGFHLGAIDIGDSTFKWLSAKSTFRNYRGSYPEDGYFDIGNRVEYPGATVNTVDKSTFWNYHGEFWKNSQTNRWQHVYDNGLLVGLFGVTTPDGITSNYEAFAQGAGNVLSSALVKIGSHYYIYHCDESVHGGIHRWRVSGLSSIKVQQIRSQIPVLNPGKVKVEYFDAQFLDPVWKKSQVMDSSMHLLQIGPNISDSSNMSMRVTAFLRVDSSDKYVFKLRIRKGARLWVDNRLILDTFLNTSAGEFVSDTIELVSGLTYPLRLEQNDYLTDVYWSGLKWNRMRLSSDRLYARDTVNSDTIQLMDGWQYNEQVRNRYYGWTRTPQADFDYGLRNHWTVQTYMKSYHMDKPDLMIRSASDSGVYTFERYLNVPGKCPVSWDLEGEINYDEDFNSILKNNTAVLEVLDDSSRVIAKMEHTKLVNGLSYQSTMQVSDSVLLSQTGLYDNIYTNRFRAFKIHVDSNGVSYTYGDYQVANMSTSAEWGKPFRLRFRFVSAQGTYGAALSVRQLRFSRKDSLQPKIYPELTQQICSGDTLILFTDSFTRYQWNTSDTGRQLNITAGGAYRVMVSRAGCRGSSAIKTIGAKPSPVPFITLTGNVIRSNYSYGNSWYFNQSPIQGANDTTYTVLIPGTYSLLVTDTNGCSSMVDLLVPLNKGEQSFTYGCSGQNQIWLETNRVKDLGLWYSDDNGQTWKRQNHVDSIRLNDNQVRYVFNILDLNNRIYLVSLIHLDGGVSRNIMDVSACGKRPLFKLVPNPFESHLNLLLPETVSLNSTLELEIYDAQGRHVWSQAITRENRMRGLANIDVSNLTQGLYTVIVLENGVIRYRTLVMCAGGH